MNNSDTKFALTRKVILYGLPLLAIIGVTVPLIFGLSNLSLLAIYLAIPMFFAPIIYLKYCRNPYEPINRDKQLFFLLLITYFLCFSISVLLLYLFEVRPFAYYVVIIVMSTSILFEILFFIISLKKSIIIILQIMILYLNIIWGVTLKYYYFIGRTDPIAHADKIAILIKYGYITDTFGAYKPFPLWHILCSSLYDILGVSIPVHKIMFFTNGLVYSFLILMVYLVSLKIFEDKRLALLSPLFVCFSYPIVYYGMSSIARSPESFFEVMLILLLIDINNSKKIFLAIILTFVIIIYHPASIPFIILILLMVYAFQKIYDIEKKRLTFNYLIIAATITLFYWIYYTDAFFQLMIRHVVNPAPSGYLTKAISYTPLNELFNYLHYSPLLLFLIYGTLWILQSKKFSGFAKIFCITGLLLVIVSFPGPVLLLNKLAFNFRLARFSEYTFLFISMAGAVGFAGMYYKSRRYFKIFVVLLFACMCFLSISNDFVASDNPLVKRPFYTYYLTEEEIVAFNHVANVTKGYLMVDYVTCRYLMYTPYNSKCHLLEIDKENTRFLRNSSDDVILIREQELNKRPLKLYSSENGKFKLRPPSPWQVSLEYYSHDLLLWKTLERYSKIYESNGVVAFH